MTILQQNAIVDPVKPRFFHWVGVEFYRPLDVVGGQNKTPENVRGLGEPKNHPIEKEKHLSGQIIATSAEVTPKGSLVGESSQNWLNSGLGIIVICPEESIQSTNFRVPC